MPSHFSKRSSGASYFQRSLQGMVRTRRCYLPGTVQARSDRGIIVLIDPSRARRGSPPLELQLEPLTPEELNYRDSSQIKGAAEIMANEAFGVPYYYGIERLCTMATNNVEELLSLAATLYDELTGQIGTSQSGPNSFCLRTGKVASGGCETQKGFHPQSAYRNRAARLLDAIGSFCREKTFQPTAPYAPGVTGEIRFSQSELAKIKLEKPGTARTTVLLRKVIAESVA